MGGGSKRKPSDKARVPRPSEYKSGNEGGAGSGAGGGNRSDSSRVCPLSFPVKLDKGVKATEKTPLTLREDGELLTVIMNRQKVATLPKGKSQQILACIQSGYRYVGQVKIIKGETYGHFERQS